MSFKAVGRELSALKPENSPPLAGCFQAGFQNENCWSILGRKLAFPLIMLRAYLIRRETNFRPIELR